MRVGHRAIPPDPGLGIEFTGYSPFVGILSVHAWMLVRAGRLAEGAIGYERAEKLAREFGDNENRTWMQLPQLESAVCRGDASAAQEHSRVALESGEKCSTPQSTWVGRLSVGIAHRLDGRCDEAISAAEFALHTTLEGANRQFEAWAGAELAMALLGRGDSARAERQAQQAADTARAQHSRSDEVRANLALAQALLAQGDGAALGRIEGALARCQELIDETGNGIFQPEVCECRSRAAALRGDAAAAKREIEQARELYADMGATAQIERLAGEA